MSINEREELINSQLKLVEETILIVDIIGGDNSKVYVEFKGRSSRFIVNEIEEIMNIYDISLERISEILEDDKLIEIKNIDDSVKKYNDQDYFLNSNTIGRIVGVNI
ncbi:hypothetical protein GA417_05580 [Poseidonibacter ostreae]|uniref:hypothetical protein n=1 Tax=Poseidonibacter ostreae TaxID=2654171 RepID=UPI0012649F77|nr:hypothetical protein [Poseidonibacter ostreae]KAB7886420.1 hypothetical protein GA417_05580 [Poseidonibacter ostreae]